MYKNALYNLDPIHNNISLTKLERLIIESTLFNRLNYISQLSTAYFVYPSANHTRNSHSVGVMYLSTKYFKHSLLNSTSIIRKDLLSAFEEELSNIVEVTNNSDKANRYSGALIPDEYITELKNFEINSKEFTESYNVLLQSLRISALLHDIGHLPFSHLTESSLDEIYNLISDKSKKTEWEEYFCTNFYDYVLTKSEQLHEIIGYAMISLIKDELIKYTEEDKHKYINIIFKITQNILKNEETKFFNYRAIHDIIASMVDSDRLDYILRDTKSIGTTVSSYDTEKIILNGVFYKNSNNETIFGLKIDALNEVERFLESRFHLYNQYLFSPESIKKHQILNQALIRLSVQYLQNTGTSNNHPYKLPLDISGLWLPLRILSNSTMSLADATDLLFQYDENWLLYILKMEYFELERQFYDGNKDYHFRNSPRTRKQYYGLREILYGEHQFKSLWTCKQDFADFLDITVQDIGKIRKIFFLDTKRTIKKFKSIVTQNEKNIDVYFGIKDFKTGINNDFLFLVNDKNGIIDLRDISPISKIVSYQLNTEPPFWFYVRDRENIEGYIDILKEELQAFSKSLIADYDKRK